MLKSVKSNNLQPKFLLKNVVPSEIYSKYKKGYFNRPIPVKSKIKIVNPNINTSTLNQDHINPIELSGKKNVEIFTKNGHQPLMGGRCTYCKCDFTTEQIGYPISYEEKQLINHDEYKTIHVFWTDDCFDSYQCCLAYVNLVNHGKIKDNLMIDAEVMLKYMYRLAFENALPLLPAKCHKLLISNGGSMSHEDWTNVNCNYIKTNSIIKIPAQVVYIRSNS